MVANLSPSIPFDRPVSGSTRSSDEAVGKCSMTAKEGISSFEYANKSKVKTTTGADSLQHHHHNTFQSYLNNKNTLNATYSLYDIEATHRPAKPNRKKSLQRPKSASRIAISISPHHATILGFLTPRTEQVFTRRESAHHATDSTSMWKPATTASPSRQRVGLSYELRPLR